MKSILYLYHTSSIGGGSFCLLNILKTMDRSLYKPMVLLKENGPLVEEIHKLDIPVFFLKGMSTVPYNVSTFTPNKIINAIKIISSLKKYKRLLKTINPDIVYVNTMMLYPYLSQASKLGIKTIIHIREHWPKGQHRLQRKIALTHIDKFADHIVAINQYSISMFKFSNKPKTIVYDWIDLNDRFKEIPMSSIFNEDMSDKKIYLYMGGMQPIKGAYEILSTFSKKINNPNARLLAMGIGKQNPSKGWKGLIKKLLSFFGRISYIEKVCNIVNSDTRIKCIPSEYKITHIIKQSYCILSYFTIPHANLALAESIILGTPTIAADTEESQEYSLNGELALLFKINSISDFENAINEFEVKKDIIIDRIHEKSCIIKELFSPERNIKKINSVYEKI